MSAPFKVGDVVVGMDDSPCPCCGAKTPITPGGIYRVIGFREGANHRLCVRIVTAFLQAVPVVGGHEGWGINVARLRKIDDEVSEDFREQLKSLGKSKERVA